MLMNRRAGHVAAAGTAALRRMEDRDKENDEPPWQKDERILKKDEPLSQNCEPIAKNDASSRQNGE